MEESVKFGLSREILVALITLAVASVGGAAFVVYSGWQQNKSVCEIKWNDEETKAHGAMMDVVALLDKRVYRTRLLVTTMSDKTKQDLVSGRRAKYRSAVFDWNENLNKNYDLVEYYFGSETRAQWEGRITPMLRHISSELDRPKPPLGRIITELNEANAEVRLFNKAMMDALNSHRVGSRIGAKGDPGVMDYFKPGCQPRPARTLR